MEKGIGDLQSAGGTYQVLCLMPEFCRECTAFFVHIVQNNFFFLGKYYKNIKFALLLRVTYGKIMWFTGGDFLWDDEDINERIVM